MTRIIILAGFAALGLAGNAQAAPLTGLADLVKEPAATAVAVFDTGAAAPVILVGTTRIVCADHKVTGTRPPRK